jgi:hypothetical protein
MNIVSVVTSLFGEVEPQALNGVGNVQNSSNRKATSRVGNSKNSSSGPTPNKNVNRAATQILTRFNLDQLNLTKLTVNQVKTLKNPNKNSCLLTKLEIVEKILQAKGGENATISQYINQLKGPKKVNVKPPLKPPPPRVVISSKPQINSNGVFLNNKVKELYSVIHPILMEYLENKYNKSILKWKSEANHDMTAKIRSTSLKNNLGAKYKESKLMIPAANIRNVTTNTGQKANGRVSIYSTNLTIDNILIKEFFINNGLSEDFVNTFIPPPFNKQSVNLFSSNKQPLFKIGDKVILRDEYYKNNKIEGSCIYKRGNYGIIKEIVQGARNLGKEYINTYLVDCYNNQNINLTQKCTIKENKIRKIDE